MGIPFDDVETAPELQMAVDIENWNVAPGQIWECPNCPFKVIIVFCVC